MANGKIHRTNRNEPTRIQKQSGYWVQNQETGCWHKRKAWEKHMASMASKQGGMTALLEDSVR